MTNGNHAAFPDNGNDSGLDYFSEYGLTKREYFAALAMQGNAGTSGLKVDQIADRAVRKRTS